MRSLEDHLSPQELASLPESPEALAYGDPGQQQLLQHLQQCEACYSVALTHWSLRSFHTAASYVASGEACPPETIWLEFAAGLHSQRLKSLLAHAASCNTCAVTLREAMDYMDFDQLGASGEATEPIEGLASATTAWQRRVAKQMRAVSGVVPPTGIKAALPRLSMMQSLRRPAAWITVSVGAIILCAVVLTSLTLWRMVHPPDAQLLAAAYNKQRTMVLRIPGGDPVALASGTRGPTKNLADSTELLQLRLRAQQQLERVPNSAYWHQVLGEIQLLEQDGLGALRNFEIAQSADPTLSNLLPDLAAAWFVIGDSTGTPVDYVRAANLYLIELHNLGDGKRHPTGPALLHYNLAFCWERQNLRDAALADFRASLAAEKSPAWRKAIQSEIDRLSTPTATPISATTLETDGYETAISNATSSLLPRWSDSTDPAGQADARAKLTQTANLGLLHQDRWLHDWIAAPHTKLAANADTHLATAVGAAAGGEAEISLTEARQALKLYTQAHNAPGRLRAAYAETYAYQRLGRSKDCIAAAISVTNGQNIDAYASIRAHALLDKAACAIRDGSFAAARRDAERVLTIAIISKLPQTHLLALSLQAGALHVSGKTSAAWQADVSGLRLCEQAACAPNRHYAFLYYMVRNAQDLALPFAAAAIMRIAVPIAADSKDAVTYAYALETLGLVEGRIGNFDASEHAFADASQIAHSGHQAALTNIYQAEWQIDQAEVLSRQGNAQRSLNLLQESAPVILASDYVPGREKYFRQASISQLTVGHYDDALNNARLAVQTAERSLTSLYSTDDREQWTRENGPFFAQLVKVYLSRGEDTAALQTWERFRSAPYPEHSRSSFAVSAPITSSDVRVLVLARVDDVYIGWLANPKSLQALKTVTLGDRARLQQMATTFYHLCADQNSNLADLRSVGAQLYAALLRPFDTELASSSQLVLLDLDPSLAMLPIAALSSPNGRWFGDSAQFALLPAWWSLNPTSAISQPSITPDLHLLVVNGFDRSQSGRSESSDIALFFTHAQIMDRSTAASSTILRELPSAELFHFSGHTSARELVFAYSASDAPETLAPESFSGVNLSRCRLAVLAACNTTAADPDQIEKLPDLRNALLLSRVHAVVASNWDVDDRSTRSLMLHFYKQLALGRPPIESLQSAQQLIRSTGGWQHPYYWSSFEVFTN
jgi:CHAT domain-containing protein